MFKAMGDKQDERATGFVSYSLSSSFSCCCCCCCGGGGGGGGGRPGCSCAWFYKAKLLTSIVPSGHDSYIYNSEPAQSCKAAMKQCFGLQAKTAYKPHRRKQDLSRTNTLQLKGTWNKKTAATTNDWNPLSHLRLVVLSIQSQSFTKNMIHQNHPF